MKPLSVEFRTHPILRDQVDLLAQKHADDERVAPALEQLAQVVARSAALEHLFGALQRVVPRHRLALVFQLLPRSLSRPPRVTSEKRLQWAFCERE